MTKKQQFELFKKECLKWQTTLGLQRYDLLFFHDISAEFEGAWNRVMYDSYAKIYLDKEQDWKKEEIKESAKHEMMHVLIGRMAIIMRSRYIAEHEPREAEEEVVRVLCKLIK